MRERRNGYGLEILTILVVMGVRALLLKEKIVPQALLQNEKIAKTMSPPISGVFDFTLDCAAFMMFRVGILLFLSGSKLCGARRTANRCAALKDILLPSRPLRDILPAFTLTMIAVTLISVGTHWCSNLFPQTNYQVPLPCPDAKNNLHNYLASYLTNTGVVTFFAMMNIGLSYLLYHGFQYGYDRCKPCLFSDARFPDANSSTNPLLPGDDPSGSEEVGASQSGGPDQFDVASVASVDSRHSRRSSGRGVGCVSAAS